LLQDTNRLAEAKPLMPRTLGIFHDSQGKERPYKRAVEENLQALLATMDPGE
jgi:hypothetical protein